jgi:hypothetical protein
MALVTRITIKPVFQSNPNGILAKLLDAPVPATAENQAAHRLKFSDVIAATLYMFMQTPDERDNAYASVCAVVREKLRFDTVNGRAFPLAMDVLIDGQPFFDTTFTVNVQGHNKKPDSIMYKIESMIVRPPDEKPSRVNCSSCHGSKQQPSQLQMGVMTHCEHCGGTGLEPVCDICGKVNPDWNHDCTR